MYNILKKIVNKTTETALFLSIGGMAATVCVQVFARFFLPSAPDWTEELARIFFIFSVGFGAGLAIRDHGYVNLNTFIEKLPVPRQRHLNLIIYLIILILATIMFVYSIQFIFIGSRETSPSMGVKMSWVFSSLLIMSILIAWYTILELISIIHHSKQ